MGTFDTSATLHLINPHSPTVEQSRNDYFVTHDYYRVQFAKRGTYAQSGWMVDIDAQHRLKKVPFYSREHRDAFLTITRYY